MLGGFAYGYAVVWHKAHKEVLNRQRKSKRAKDVYLRNGRHGVGAFDNAFEVGVLYHKQRRYEDVREHTHRNHTLFGVSVQRCEEKQRFRDEKHYESHHSDRVVNLAQAVVFFGKFALDFEPWYADTRRENRRAYETQSQKQNTQLLRVLTCVEAHFHCENKAREEQKTVKENDWHMVLSVRDVRERFEYRALSAECAANRRNHRKNHAPKRNQHEFHHSRMVL